jgi:aryl-alcohol dehydrogenase-like predicted oxidoreductase
VTLVIVGMAAPEEVDENIATVQAAVPADLWTDLAEQGLLESTEGGPG